MKAEILSRIIESLILKAANIPIIVAVNKMDLPDAQANLEKFKKAYPEAMVIPISAIRQDGIDKAMEELMNIIEATPKSQIYDAKDYASHVVYKYENVLPFTIKKVNGMWLLECTEISKL